MLSVKALRAHQSLLWHLIYDCRGQEISTLKVDSTVMATLKSHDLISLQSTIFFEEPTNSFSAQKPVLMASKYSEKQGASAFIKRKTLNSQ